MERRKTRLGLVDRRYNVAADTLIEEMHRAGHGAAAIHEECVRRGIKVSPSLVSARLNAVRLAEQEASSSSP